MLSSTQPWHRVSQEKGDDRTVMPGEVGKSGVEWLLNEAEVAQEGDGSRAW